MMDCTGSMCSHIEAVKANIKKIRDDLATKYKGCIIRFAFVQYTDFDQPQSTRITYLNFTELVLQSTTIISHTHHCKIDWLIYQLYHYASNTLIS